MSLARANRRIHDNTRSVSSDEIADGIRHHANYVVWLTIGITILGLIIGYSASATELISRGLAPTSEILKELEYTGYAFGLLIFTVRFSRFAPNAKGAWLYVGVKTFFWISIVLVTLLHFTATDVKGSSRTLDFGYVHFQPTELAKFTIVAYLLYLMLVEPSLKGVPLELNLLFTRVRFKLRFLWDITNDQKRGVSGLLVMALILLLIVFQPDVGSTLFIGVLSLIALSMGGLRKRVIFTIVGLAVAMLLYIIVFKPPLFAHVTDRIDAWLNPLGTVTTVDSSGAEVVAAPKEKVTTDDQSYQILQSLGAIANGGLAGQGYFRGVQKINRLPEQTNDFIFAVACEELGFLGALFIVSLFVALLYNMTQIAIRIRTPFYSALVFLVGFAIFTQACINMATAANAAPTTGINLPLISFGGTSKLVTLTQIGIVLAIARTFSTFERTRVQ